MCGTIIYWGLTVTFLRELAGVTLVHGHYIIWVRDRCGLTSTDQIILERTASHRFTVWSTFPQEVFSLSKCL